MNSIVQDTRYGWRMLLKRPGFAAAIVLTLALGVGANTAIFSIINGVLLRPLPYEDQDDLVVLWSRCPGLDEERTFPSGMYFQIKDRTHAFDQVAIIQSHSFTLSEEGPPERVRGVRASVSGLTLLGAKPVLGRLFTPGEDQAGKPRTIILSHALWERRFGADPTVIGRPLRLKGHDYTVIGVLEEGFPVTRAYLPMLRDQSAKVDYWIPLVLSEEDRARHSGWDYAVYARLGRGVTMADAQAEMNLLASCMTRELPRYYPPQNGFAIDLEPLFDLMVRDTRPALGLLAGAAGLVLLIACTNIANLLLARSTERRREIGMRMALGAGRARLLRQLLTESVLLSLLGGAAGLLIAWWGTSSLLALAAETMPRIGEVDIDALVIVFTFGLSLFTGIVFGLAPAWRMSNVNLEGVLREGSRGKSAAGALWSRRHSLRRILVVAEISLSLVLLVGAGLLVHSYYNLQRVDLGFAPANVLSFGLPENRSYRDMGEYVAFYEELGEHLTALPGVESVGGISGLPLAVGGASDRVSVEDYVSSGDDAGVPVAERTVLGDYFETMKIPLVAGRYFNKHDTAESRPVAIVDETFARRYWPNDNPIGKRVRNARFDASIPWLTVVGVVGAVKGPDLESAPQMTYYQPYAQWAYKWMYMVVRTSVDPGLLTDAIANEVWTLDRDRPLLRVATMEQRVSHSLAKRRFALLLLGIFAAIALVLAVVGLYAVMAQTVGHSTHEIGIRMALGARGGEVLALVLRQGLTLTAIGLAIGLIAALGLVRVLSSQLYEVNLVDPVAFSVFPLLLAATALLACYIPARRATKVDPMVALRHE